MKVLLQLVPGDSYVHPVSGRYYGWVGGDAETADSENFVFKAFFGRIQIPKDQVLRIITIADDFDLSGLISDDNETTLLLN